MSGASQTSGAQSQNPQSAPQPAPAPAVPVFPSNMDFAVAFNQNLEIVDTSTLDEGDEDRKCPICLVEYARYPLRSRGEDTAERAVRMGDCKKLVGEVCMMKHLGLELGSWYHRPCTSPLERHWHAPLHKDSSKDTNAADTCPLCRCWLVYKSYNTDIIVRQYMRRQQAHVGELGQNSTAEERRRYVEHIQKPWRNHGCCNVEELFNCLNWYQQNLERWINPNPDWYSSDWFSLKINTGLSMSAVSKAVKEVFDRAIATVNPTDWPIEVDTLFPDLVQTVVYWHKKEGISVSSGKNNVVLEDEVHINDIKLILWIWLFTDVKDAHYGPPADDYEDDTEDDSEDDAQDDAQDDADDSAGDDAGGDAGDDAGDDADGHVENADQDNAEDNAEVVLGDIYLHDSDADLTVTDSSVADESPRESGEGGAPVGNHTADQGALNIEEGGVPLAITLGETGDEAEEASSGARLGWVWESELEANDTDDSDYEPSEEPSDSE